MVAWKRLAMMVVAAVSITMLLGQSSIAAASGKSSMRAFAWDFEMTENKAPTKYAKKPGQVLPHCQSAPVLDLWVFVRYKKMAKKAPTVTVWKFNGNTFLTLKEKWDKAKNGIYAPGIGGSDGLSDGLYKISIKVKGKNVLNSSVTLETEDC